MRNSIGVLYLMTGLVCLYWSVQLTLTGMYGAPFSWWYAAIFVGSLVLIFGAILGWVSGQRWTDWVPLVGSVVLAAYFIPAIVVTFRRYVEGQAPGSWELAIRVAVVLLVVASLAVAARNILPLKTQ
jgi:uncharacterized membrane protein YhaH (DUF805 family)